MNQSINTDSKNKQQQGTTTEAAPWNGQYKNTGGLNRIYGYEQHHWNTGAIENQQLNPSGPSNRQKNSGPNQLK